MSFFLAFLVGSRISRMNEKFFNLRLRMGVLAAVQFKRKFLARAPESEYGSVRASRSSCIERGRESMRELMAKPLSLLERETVNVQSMGIITVVFIHLYWMMNG